MVAYACAVQAELVRANITTTKTSHKFQKFEEKIIQNAEAHSIRFACFDSGSAWTWRGGRESKEW